MVVNKTNVKNDMEELFAQSELERMKYSYDALSLIRNKDGVSVWRVMAGDGSVVLKCFKKPQYRREIVNYQILNTLGVPTLKVMASTDCSFIIEDIERTYYRLATKADMQDAKIAAKIATWYRSLHQKGREYANTHDLIDEYDSLTLENLRFIQNKTATNGLKVWQRIEKYFVKIQHAVMALPRTLAYTDFHFSNLAVAKDASSALMFDYNYLSKSYVYSDIRNVCRGLVKDEVKAAFLSAYGSFDEQEKTIDDVARILLGLLIASQRAFFPLWADALLEAVKDGQLLTSVEMLMDTLNK